MKPSFLKFIWRHYPFAFLFLVYPVCMARRAWEHSVSGVIFYAVVTVVLAALGYIQFRREFPVAYCPKCKKPWVHPIHDWMNLNVNDFCDYPMMRGM